MPSEIRLNKDGEEILLHANFFKPVTRHSGNLFGAGLTCILGLIAASVTDAGEIDAGLVQASVVLIDETRSSSQLGGEEPNSLLEGNAVEPFENYGELQAIGGTRLRSDDLSSTAAIGGTRLRAIGGTRLRADTESETAAIGGTRLRAIGGTRLRAIGGTRLRADDDSETAAIGGTRLRAIGGTRLRTLDESGIAAIGGTRLRETCLVSDQTLAIGGTRLRAIGGTRLRAIGGTRLRADDDSETAAIGGTRLRAIGGTRLRAIGGTRLRADDDSETAAIGGTRLRAIGGTRLRNQGNADLAELAPAILVGPVSSIDLEEGTAQILSATIRLELSDQAESTPQAGELAAVVSCAGGSERTIVVPYDESFVPGVSEVVLSGIVEASDPTTATFQVDGYKVDYSSLLVESPDGLNVPIGSMVTVKGTMF